MVLRTSGHFVLTLWPLLLLGTKVFFAVSDRQELAGSYLVRPGRILGLSVSAVIGTDHVMD